MNTRLAEIPDAERPITKDRLRELYKEVDSAAETFRDLARTGRVDAADADKCHAIARLMQDATNSLAAAHQAIDLC